MRRGGRDESDRNRIHARDAPEAVFDHFHDVTAWYNEDREVTAWFAGIAAAFVVAAGGLSLLWFNRIL